MAISKSPAVPTPAQRTAADEDLTPLGREPTPAEVRHFLSRTSFAYTPTAAAEIATLGFGRYVDRMLDVNAFPGVTTVEKQAHSIIMDPDYPEEESVVWSSMLVYTPNPFQELLAIFWDGHFGASFSSLQSGNQHYAPDYVRLLRTKGTGSFKELVAEVSTSPVMLVFLNGVDSTKEAPNENFARELWELFTLGRDNGYTQADIVQAARALTGYVQRFPPGVDSKISLAYDPERHDSGDKQIFGQTLEGRSGADGAQEYRDLVELTFSARDPAPWIAGKLWEYFVYLDPSEKLVAALAAELHAQNWSIAALLRTMFSSKAFYSPAANVGIIKSPIEYVVGYLRATGLMLPVMGVNAMLKHMGQCPGFPPAVNGWPSGPLWLSSAQVVARANVVGATLLRMPLGALEHLLPPVEQRTKAEIVTALTDHLNLSIEPEERHLYEESLDAGRDGEATPAPFEGSDPKMVSERVGNLLYVLAQHPAYHLR